MKNITFLKSKKNLTSTLLMLVTLVGFTAAYAAQLKSYSGDTPPLQLQSLQGDAVDLADYKGKVTLVQFWATYCTPCRVEMPSMNRLQEKLGDNFAILAVNMGEPSEEVQRFVDEVQPEFSVLLDKDGSALAQWKVFAAPASFIVDPKGDIRYTLYGATEWDADEMVEQLQSLM